MKTIEEQINVMQHFANGGEVEFIVKNNKNNCWQLKDKEISFNFTKCNYRIKEKKQTVTIEKWLLKMKGNLFAAEGCSNYFKDLSSTLNYEKIQLLETYEVEIND